MHGLLRRSLLAVLLLCLGSRCGPSHEEDTQAPFNVQITNVTQGEIITGTRRLHASAEDDSGRVARMEFRVSGTLACTDGTTRGSGALFACNWNSSTTPEGNYQLIATAYDEAGNATGSEPVSFTVPPPPPNQQPTLSSVKATPDVLDEGSSTTLAVTASDPDGNPLTYSWTQTPPTPAGRFSDSTAASPTWTAPSLTSDQTFTLQVTVSDGKGGTAQDSVEVLVASVNAPPVVDAAITASATVIAGDSLKLSIGARDPDGDPLTYEWTATPVDAGLLEGATASSARWRSRDIGANTVVTFQVTVSDTKDSVTRSVDVQVKVPTYAQVQQVWDATCTDCHNAKNASGGLNLVAASSYDALVDSPGTSSACTTSKRVEPGLPNASLLVQKISGTTCGTRMPMGNPSYFDSNPALLIRIRSWILAGAPSD